jgi:hypothetical protein
MHGLHTLSGSVRACGRKGEQTCFDNFRFIIYGHFPKRTEAHTSIYLVLNYVINVIAEFAIFIRVYFPIPLASKNMIFFPWVYG